MMSHTISEFQEHIILHDGWERWFTVSEYIFSGISSNSHLPRPAICLSSASFQVTYVRAWIVHFHAMLQWMIVQYGTVSKQVFDAAKKKLELHLWYLGPELMPMCLFSEKASTEAKQKICEAMLQCGEETGAIAESNCKTARNWKTKNCTSW